jgi:hypothetical protein
MTEPGNRASDSTAAGGATPLLVFAWLFVGLPLAWAVWQVIQKSVPLFTK